MLRVALVGCGKIADAHASLIQHLPGCEIVGVCDREALMARQLCERFPVRHCFTDVTDLLRQRRPDVVHVTTPPDSHFNIARVCLEHGSHVYVEKPFTVTLDETERLLALARAQRRKVTVGHDDQFTHAARRLRALVAADDLGGAPVHMDSYYCYDLRDPAYARAMLGDTQHWVRRLPGRLLHNVISHGIARIAEFLDTESPHVLAYGYVSPLLRRLDETDIIDELRVIIADEQRRTTAYFTFSSQIRPPVREFRIYGPRNGLFLDHNHDVLIRLPGRRYKSYLEKFLPPMAVARQYLQSVLGNVGLFAAGDYHMKSGMRYLIESFYRSLVSDAPVPIPYRQILLTARLMDEIFSQIYPGAVAPPAPCPPGSPSPPTPRDVDASLQHH
jgi:predicted dehydrogenase